MKLYIDDSGAVICDADEINESFWSRVRFKYFYFTDKGIRRAKVEAANYIFSDYHEAGRDYFTLKAIVDEAERYGVDVAPGIKSRLSELEKLWRNMYEDEQKRLDEQKKKARWEVLRSIGCGTCVIACPTGAIDKSSFECEKAKCISCLRCIKVCPMNCRYVPEELLAKLKAHLAPLCASRKDNEFFI